jgi:hypothetical protein
MSLYYFSIEVQSSSLGTFLLFYIATNKVYLFGLVSALSHISTYQGR